VIAGINELADDLDLPRKLVNMSSIESPDERNRMAKYISLLRFTEQGARNIQESIDRAHEFGKAAAKAGVTIEGQYWTLGAYDGVLILSAESDAMALHCLVELAAQGYVRTETLQAFTDQGFSQIVKK
jgi:uncharacterized protein with GYD domain